MEVAPSLLLLLCLLAAEASCSVVILNGGYLTVNGSITGTYYDLTIDFQANVQWVAMIWSQNEADTDVTLFKVNSLNPADPVTKVDCYLDQNSYIQTDNVQNLMPSGNTLKGDISNGIKAHFKRELITGDNKDITLYADSVIQVCFMAANEPFQGAGYETGNEKACSYLSLHKNADKTYDRMLGNFAATSTFGGGNLTVYATESYDGNALETWLFLTVVHKAQGLTAFSPKWIGVLYSNSLVNADMALAEYSTEVVELDIHIKDFYSVNNSYAAKDDTFVVQQGSQDVVEVLKAYDPTSYFVASFKRKYSTGDVNRDQNVASGPNTYCFIFGDALAFSSFQQTENQCFSFSLST